jgi:hypothetical protein
MVVLITLLMFHIQFSYSMLEVATWSLHLGLVEKPLVKFPLFQNKSFAVCLEILFLNVKPVQKQVNTSIVYFE